MEGIQVALATCTERRAWDPQPVKSEAAHTVASGVKHFQDGGFSLVPPSSLLGKSSLVLGTLFKKSLCTATLFTVTDCPSVLGIQFFPYFWFLSAVPAVCLCGIIYTDLTVTVWAGPASIALSLQLLTFIGSKS